MVPARIVILSASSPSAPMPADARVGSGSMASAVHVTVEVGRVRPPSG
jgi:hypothetical protein